MGEGDDIAVLPQKGCVPKPLISTQALQQKGGLGWLIRAADNE